MSDLGENLSEKEIDEMLECVDLNKDGKVSFEEFKQMFEYFWKKILLKTSILPVKNWPESSKSEKVRLPDVIKYLYIEIKMSQPESGTE